MSYKERVKSFYSQINVHTASSYNKNIILDGLDGIDILKSTVLIIQGCQQEILIWCFSGLISVFTSVALDAFSCHHLSIVHCAQPILMCNNDTPHY